MVAKGVRLIVTTVVGLFLAGCPADGSPPVDLPQPTAIHEEVDVFVGTGGRGFGVGSTYPGPTTPYGMIKPSPDTEGASSTIGALHCGGYRAEDPFIAGFSHIHSNGMGTADYGVILFQPQLDWTGERTERDYMLPKGREEGRAGFYAVELIDDVGSIDVGLTAADRAAMHRYSFGGGGQPGVIIDLSHTLPDGTWHDGELTIDGADVSGWTHFSGAYSGRHGGEVIHFAATFDPAPTAYEDWDEDGRLGAHLFFDEEAVEVRVAISFVDGDGARANLAADVGDATFEEVLAGAEAAWADRLSAFAVAGGDPVDRAIFASSAYHALVMPTLLTDADGRYPGFDGEVHVADGWTYYSDFSMWDTYRTVHPLLNLVWPEVEVDFLRSLMTMHEQGGTVPQWPLGTGYTGGMVGLPQGIVIADSLIRGVGTDAVDPAFALDALLFTADTKDRWTDEYMARGWLADDTGGGSISKTLEYAWAGAALANLAEAAGQDAQADELRAGSRAWRPLFDAETGFVRPKMSDGTFLDPFDPEVNYDAFVEGNAWQYTFMTPLDLDGLVEVFGSEEALLTTLRRFFEQTSYEDDPVAIPSLYYWHGNEPDIHSAFLFSLLGRRDEAVHWSRWVEDVHYDVGPEGLPGNEDGGTMGAWYVFSAAGLYPLAGTLDYVLTEPRFDAVRLRAGDGWLLTAKVGEGPYDRITVNGEEWTSPTVSWGQIGQGAEIVWWGTQ